MTALEQWGVPLAVLGMLLAMLFMAAVLKLYQTHQALVRVRVRRLELGIHSLRGALDSLRGVPLSRELRVTLRSDVVARYRRIGRLYRRYPALVQRLREAEDAMNAEGAPPQGGVGPLEDEQAFRKVVGAIDELVGIIERGDTLQPIPRDVRGIFRRELGERHAEVNARFHLVQSKRFELDGNTNRARAHLTTLLQVLKRSRPGTEFIGELHAEAQNALNELSARQFDSSAADTAGQSGASLARSG